MRLRSFELARYIETQEDADFYLKFAAEQGVPRLTELVHEAVSQWADMCDRDSLKRVAD